MPRRAYVSHINSTFGARFLHANKFAFVAGILFILSRALCVFFSPYIFAPDRTDVNFYTRPDRISVILISILFRAARQTVLLAKLNRIKPAIDENYNFSTMWRSSASADIRFTRSRNIARPIVRNTRESVCSVCAERIRFPLRRYIQREKETHQALITRLYRARADGVKLFSM